MAFLYRMIVNRRVIGIRAFALHCLCFGFLLTSACGRKAPASFERPPAPVSVAQAVTRDVPIYLDAIGKIAAREVVSVQPQVSGRITQIHFVDGADIKIGQVLFTIDPRPFRAQLNAAKANLAQGNAALDLAKINFARVESVTDQRAVSRQDYDAKKNAVAVAEAQLQQYQAAVENAQLNLDYCTIRSPINGRAGQRLVDIGNVVNANNTTLLVIQRLDPVYADFTIPENELTAVQQNMARGTLTTEVRLPDDSERPREGKLTFLDNSVQEGTGTVKLRATIENKDRRFWPGRFAQIRLVLSTRKNAVLIPAEGPQMSPKGPFVYVVKADSTAELRPVTVGQRQGDLVVVDKGLQAGERVVTNGQLGVTPGGKVSVAQPVAPGSQPAPAKPKGQS
jgi:multidrug efflux system membrane fusion protein